MPIAILFPSTLNTKNMIDDFVAVYTESFWLERLKALCNLHLKYTMIPW